MRQVRRAAPAAWDVGCRPPPLLLSAPLVADLFVHLQWFWHWSHPPLDCTELADSGQELGQFALQPPPLDDVQQPLGCRLAHPYLLQIFWLDILKMLQPGYLQFIPDSDKELLQLNLILQISRSRVQHNGLLAEANPTASQPPPLPFSGSWITLESKMKSTIFSSPLPFQWKSVTDHIPEVPLFKLLCSFLRSANAGALRANFDSAAKLPLSTATSSSKQLNCFLTTKVPLSWHSLNKDISQSNLGSGAVNG